MARLLMLVLGFIAARLMACWRATLWCRAADDPRPALRASGRRYVYAILHAQQLNFILLSDDVPILAMVSASKDGDWLVSLCRARRIVPVRGSTGTGGADKGGRAALAQMVEGVKEGFPALLAVDGPRGPRNGVHRGIVDLAREADACIIATGVFAPTNRFILKRTWDRTQLPLPFSTLTARFRPPIDPRDFPDAATLRARVGVELLALEREFDPDEARHAGRISPRAQARSEAAARAASTSARVP
jgi:lysophospholipid acyltransferase (LPLAT)-like uncharacterized protein